MSAENKPKEEAPVSAQDDTVCRLCKGRGEYMGMHEWFPCDCVGTWGIPRAEAED